MNKIKSLTVAALLSLSAFAISGCGDDGAADRKREEEIITISNRPIEKISGGHFTAIRQVLYSRGVRECETIYGVDTSNSGREWLVFCAVNPPEEMTKDFTHYLWRVYTVWPSLNDAYRGNYTHHCRIVASDAVEKCPFVRQGMK